MEDTYKILIGMTEDTLEVVDISDAHNIEMIGIEGNERMKWESQADIDKFVEYIRDFYNIDSFEDICMNVSIIYADTDMEYLHYLYLQIKEAFRVNVIQTEQILPFVSLSMGLFNDKKKSICIELMKKHYRVFQDKDKSYVCQKADSGKDVQNIPLSDLACFYYLTGSNIKGEDEVKQLNELWKSKLKEEIRKCEEKCNDKLEKMKNTNTALEKELRAKIKKLEEQLSNKKKDGERYFVTHHHTPVFNGFLADLMMFGDEKAFYTLSAKYANGQLVKEGNEVGTIQLKRGDYSPSSVQPISIEANHSGCIFWLFDKSEKEPDGKNIAVIGTMQDTVDDINDWLARMHCKERVKV